MSSISKLHIIYLFLIFSTIEIAKAADANLWLEYPRNDDCHPESTKNTLKFLRLQPDQLADPKLDNKTAGFKPDCALRKTDLEKLNSYLEGKGFFSHPGSLIFINAQDTMIKLSCSNGKKKNIQWTIQGSKNDAEFNQAKNKGDQLIIAAPADHLYFRKYTCKQVGKDPKRCSHTFYTITRPLAKINFPLQFIEGNEIEMTCGISRCLVEECGSESNPTIPRSQPPYFFQWGVPKAIVEKDNVAEPYSCRTSKDHPASKPVYIKFEAGPDKKPLAVPKLKKGVEAKLSLVKEGMMNDFRELSLKTVIESKLTISKGTVEQRGMYECIIIDGNGVPSIPTTNSLPPHTRFSGRAQLHIRGFIWIIIPLALLGVFLLIAILINFCAPLKMEHDDGTPYSKDELVGPEDSKNKGAPLPYPGQVLPPAPENSALLSPNSTPKAKTSRVQFDEGLNEITEIPPENPEQ